MSAAISKNAFFYASVFFVIVLSSIRSYPVYGKLDFFLLDGRTWWPSWRPMIETVINLGNQQPILSDMITCTVLRGVFGQRAVAFRFDHRYNHVDIEQFIMMNREQVLPYGALLLLFKENSISPDADEEASMSVSQLLTDTVMFVSRRKKERVLSEQTPYRCLINLQSFTTSWVPTETGHWSPAWGDPSLLYEFKGKHGKEMETILREEIPENCMVYF